MYYPTLVSTALVALLATASAAPTNNVNVRVGTVVTDSGAGPQLVARASSAAPAASTGDAAATDPLAGLLGGTSTTGGDGLSSLLSGLTGGGAGAGAGAGQGTAGADGGLGSLLSGLTGGLSGGATGDTTGAAGGGDLLSGLEIPTKE